MNNEHNAEVNPSEILIEEELTAETETAEDIEETIEPEEAEDAEDSAEPVKKVIGSRFKDDDDDTEDAEQDKKKRKGPFIMVPVIISAIIVFLSVAGYFTYQLFFLHEPEDILWTYSDKSGDVEINYYYEFNKDGKFTIYADTVEFTGTFEKLHEDDKDYMILNFDGTGSPITTSIAGLYAGYNAEYTVSGNRFSKNQELTLSYGDGEYTMTLAQADERKNLLEPSEDFTADEKLTGDWTNGQMVLSFRDDGVLVQDNSVDGYGIKFYYTYTVEKGSFNMTYYANGQYSVDNYKYKIKGNKLYFLDFVLTRVDPDATPDEA